MKIERDRILHFGEAWPGTALLCRVLKAPASFPVASYHCLSRLVDRPFVFGPTEREPFIRPLREDECFRGVRVLTDGIHTPALAACRTWEKAGLEG